jgi:ABC-type uncharacterized transport system involved in gliding motility auxiliary subunit
MTDSPQQQPVSARHLQRAALAGVDPDTEPATVAADILGLARSAIANHGGHPYGGWSMREQLAVALVLEDQEHLADMGYTTEQAEQAVADGTGDSYIQAIQPHGGITQLSGHPNSFGQHLMEEAVAREISKLR